MPWYPFASPCLYHEVHRELSINRIIVSQSSPDPVRTLGNQLNKPSKSTSLTSLSGLSYWHRIQTVLQSLSRCGTRYAGYWICFDMRDACGRWKCMSPRVHKESGLPMEDQIIVSRDLSIVLPSPPKGEQDRDEASFEPEKQVARRTRIRGFVKPCFERTVPFQDWQRRGYG